jgi:RimJ/RimL family protein N-acetyltransferase
MILLMTEADQEHRTVQLGTKRLLLRDFVPDDFTDVHAYAREPQSVRYMDWGPNTEAQTADFLTRKLAAQRAAPRAEYELAVVLKETGRVIGGIGLRLSRPAHHAGDMGYVFNPQYWGRGYCTEAAAAILTFGLGELGLHRIYATCDPENRASARVMEKIGMKYEGRLRDYTWEKERWRDSLVYAILETDPQSRSD